MIGRRVMQICIDFLYFQIGDKVFLRVKLETNSLKMKSVEKYPSDTVVLLEVLGWIGKRSYKLAVIPNAYT